MQTNDQLIRVSIVTDYYAGKFQSVIDHLSDHIHWVSHKMANVQLHSKEAVIRFLEKVPAGRFTFENTKFILDDQHVVVEGICRYLNHEGRPIENYYCDIFTFEGTNLVNVSSYFL